MKPKLLLSFLLLGIGLHALENYIGYTPEEIIDIFGAPHYLEVDRGDDPTHDDVIFFYDSRLYIYFNRSRVWQVRVDREFNMDVDGLHIGDSREYVTKLFGEPDKSDATSMLYRREDMGFPVYLKLYFDNNRVDDIYLFRGDY